MTLNILVSMSRGGWRCNRVCPAVIARWSVENVWYNIVIERVLPAAWQCVGDVHGLWQLTWSRDGFCTDKLGQPANWSSCKWIFIGITSKGCSQVFLSMHGHVVCDFRNITEGLKFSSNIATLLYSAVWSLSPVNLQRSLWVVEIKEGYEKFLQLFSLS